MPLHDTSYQHWEGVHLGLWRRRWAIARNGLTACLQNKWMRHLVVLCWGAALAMTAVLFLVGQLLVADSVVVQWVGNLNPQPPGLRQHAHHLAGATPGSLRPHDPGCALLLLWHLPDVR